MHIMAEQQIEDRQVEAALSATVTMSNMATIFAENDHLASCKTTTVVAANSMMELQTTTEAALATTSITATYQASSSFSANLFSRNSASAVAKGTHTDLLTSPITTPSNSFTSDASIQSIRSSVTSTMGSIGSTPLKPKSILKNGGSRLEANQESGDDEDDEEDGLSQTTDASSLDDFDDCEDEAGDENEGMAEDDSFFDDSGNDADEDLSVTDSFSFISFGNSVRFAETIIVIAASHEIESTPEDNMTTHERMLLAQSSKPSNSISSLNGREYDPDEHSRDVVDLDKDLLVAYINGLRTVDIDDCKTVLHSRTHHLHCDKRSISEDTEAQMNEYLDRIVELLLGFFPNMFTDAEYNRILDQAELAIAFDKYGRDQFSYQPESVNVQKMLQQLLEEKVSIDNLILVDEIFGWLAGELLEPLGRRAYFRKRFPA